MARVVRGSRHRDRFFSARYINVVFVDPAYFDHEGGFETLRSTKVREFEAGERAAGAPRERQKQIRMRRDIKPVVRAWFYARYSER